MQEQQFREYLTIEAGLSKKTIGVYVTYFRHFIAYNKELNKDTIYHFLTSVLPNVAPSTSSQNNAKKTINHIIDWLGLDIPKLKLKRAMRGIIYTLNDDEQRRFLEEVYKYDFRAGTIFHTVLCTGISLSEVKSLKIGHFMYDRLYIQKSKTGKSRYVYLVDSQLVDNIQLLVDDVLNAKARELWLFQKIYGEGAQQGSPGKRWLYMVMRTALQKAKIKKPLTFHHLRHTYADTQRRKGVDIFTIQLDLGHSDVRTTQGYMHINEEDRIVAARKNPNVKYVPSESEYHARLYELQREFIGTPFVDRIAKAF